MALAGVDDFYKIFQGAYKSKKNQLASNLKINDANDLGMLNKIQAGIDGFKQAAQIRMFKNPELKNSVMGDKAIGKTSWMDIGESMLKNRKGEYQAGRIAGMAAGTMVAGAVGVRAATGGGWAVNSSGQRDLVGVPFI